MWPNIKYLSLVIFIIYHVTSYFYYQKTTFTFDEPHYLLAAKSIAYDGDFDLKDEYKGKEYSKFYSGALDPHISPNSIKDGWYSIHGYGLPILLAPLVYAADLLSSLESETTSGTSGANAGSALVAYQWIIGIFLSTLLTAAFYMLAKSIIAVGQANNHSKQTFLSIWSLFFIFLLNPILVYSKFLSVEIIAFAYVSYLVWVIHTRGYDKHVKYFIPFFSGLLIWVHVKFTIVSLTTLCFLIIHYRNKITLRDFLVASALSATPVIALLVVHQHLYGSASLTAPYATGALSHIYVLQGVFGQFLDAHTGLFFAAPIYALLLYPLVRKTDANALRTAWRLCFLLGVPLLVLTSMHVLVMADIADASKNYDLIQSWFIQSDKIPMWFQTPIARFMFPVAPIIAFLLANIMGSLLSSLHRRIVVATLLIISITITYAQIIGFPHTLFRPNGDFESYAPLWSKIFGDHAWLAPNYLSFRQPLNNFVLGLIWLTGLLTIFNLIEKKWIAFAGFATLVLVSSAIVIPNIERYGSYVEIHPYQMSSNVSSKNVDGAKVIFADRPISGDILFGPYIYLPQGRYCATMDGQLVGDFAQLKWYVRDTYSWKVLDQHEIHSSEKSGELFKKFCFDNFTPHYPKEIIIYTKEFLGALKFFGVTLRRE